MNTLKKLAALIWPLTRAKLHRLVTLVGYAFAALAVGMVWAEKLGINTTSGKLGATAGILATAAASWATLRPKLEAAIDTLPIPAADTTEAAAKPTVVPINPPKGTP